MFVPNLDINKNLQNIKSTINHLKSFKNDGEIIFKDKNKMVINVFESTIINSLIDFQHNLNSEVKELLIRSFDNYKLAETFLDIKGINNIVLLCIDFSHTGSNKEAATIAIFERDLTGKELYTLKTDNMLTQRTGLGFLKRKFSPIFETNLFTIDNEKIVEAINNCYKEGERLKRNYKLTLLTKYSTEDKPIYDTYEYLSARFDLSIAQELWLIKYKQFWDNKIQYANAERKGKYFHYMEEYFGEHEEFEKNFNDIKIKHIQHKVSVF